MKVAGMTSKTVINTMSQVAESVGDTQTGDDMKQIRCVNTGNTMIDEKINNRIQTAIDIKHHEEEKSTYVYYIYYYNFLQ